MFEFNEIQFPFEVENYENLTAFQQALKAMEQEESQLQESNSAKEHPAEYIREYCQMVFRFFDTALGERSAEKMFGGAMNYGVCEEALLCFIEYFQSNTQQAQESRRAREERRAKLYQYMPVKSGTMAS